MTDERTRGAAQPVLDAASVRTWVRDATDTVARHRDALDGMNVFPVPDSDTGTNLWLTLAQAAAAVDRLGPDADLAQVTRALTRGAVLGSRGNSGVIVSQYLAGLVHAATRADAGWAEVLAAAADAAYGAVGRPVEGTVLTVAREVAEAARAATPGVGALEEGLARGYAALARTTDELPVLRAAGVCDAGASGLLLVLEALTRTVGGQVRADGCPALGPGGACDRHPRARGVGARPAGSTGDGPAGRPRPAAAARPHVHVAGAHLAPVGEDGVAGGEFEVMFVVDDETGAPGLGDRLRSLLADVGDSVAVVGASGLWQTHVHTDDLEAALAVPARAGAPTRPAVVRHLLSQAGVHGERRPGLGVVAVTGAAGLAPDLARAGAVVVLASPGQGAPGELARAVEDTGADDVLVLASVPVDEHALGTGGHVEVRSGLTDVHLVAAAAALAIAREDADVRAVVTGAVEGLRHAVVRGVGRDVGGGAEDPRVNEATDALLDGHPDAEVLTVVVGTAVPPGAVADLPAHVARTRPGVEVVVLPGAAEADVLLGVE